MCDRVDYDEYMKSDAWQAKRTVALSRAANKCSLCGSPDHLNVHHNTYERLGNELDSDLSVLCHDCHEVFHAKRDKRTKRKYAREKWLRDRQSKPYTALPPIPQPVPAEPIAMAPAKRTRHKVSDATGKMVVVTVTREYMDTIVRPSGVGQSISFRGLRLIGEPVPWQNGWRHRAIGRMIEVDEGELLAERIICAARQAGVEIPDQVKSVFTPEEEATIRLTYNSDHGMGIKAMAKKWGCYPRDIRRIVKGKK